MSGVKYLLDTNFILGMLKSSPAVLQTLTERQLTADQCAFSAITRMELLGFPGITTNEQHLVQQTLDRFRYLAISLEIEDKAISMRRTRQVKLPDALIAATALCHDLELLTLDRDLQSVMKSVQQAT